MTTKDDDSNEFLCVYKSYSERTSEHLNTKLEKSFLSSLFGEVQRHAFFFCASLVKLGEEVVMRRSKGALIVGIKVK